MRARKPVVTASAALALFLTGPACLPLPAAQAAPAAGGQAAPGGQAPGGQKNYKDRGEYDLYNQAVQQAKDPKAQLQTLQTWQDKYPQTDFQTERLQLFINALRQLAPSDPAAAKQLLDKCAALLKIDPKNFQANYFTVLWGPRTVQAGGTAPPDLLTQVDTSAHAVLDNLPPKPANMSDTEWDKAKGGIQAVAHNAIAWEDIQKKDNAGAETEYKASLQADPSQANVSAGLGKMLVDEKDDNKIPQALFEYARAAQYDGPGALPADQRTKLTDYVKTQYTNFHGSADGLDQLMAQAKTAAVPPDGFTIANANKLAQQEADALNARIASDPAFKIWYAIESNLKDKGDAFFNSDVKDVEVPGGAEGVKNFSGTVISLDPPTAPTKVVLGVQDPAKPDATLEFSQPLPPDALNTIKVGQKVDFAGIADSYTKDPYMLTFKDPTIPGVKTATPPRQGRKRHQ